jgi:hypothetical protein
VTKFVKKVDPDDVGLLLDESHESSGDHNNGFKRTACHTSRSAAVLVIPIELRHRFAFSGHAIPATFEKC